MPPIASADALDLDTLLTMISEGQPDQVAFTEKRRLTVLAEVIESEGMIRFREPATVEREITSPFQQRLIFAGEYVTVVEEGAVQHQLHRDDDPGLAALSRFVKALYGKEDSEAIEAFFNVKIDGAVEEWSLSLRPKERSARRRFTRVELYGSQGWVERSALYEANGDVTMTHFERP
ncbi:hypothetical protein CKO15_10205 [Halorhodospira abdelmalekii]|nr:hypothetical protein [Halorhodospira abdelmalekii]